MSKAAASEVDRTLALDIVRVTEAAAVAAAEWRGRGDEVAADIAAATAMYRALAAMPIEATVVVGEGEADETPLLYIGETVGAGGKGPRVDLAVDAVEGLTLCAKALPNALSVLVLAEHGTLLKVPPIYMDKIAIGPSFPEGLVDLDASPADNLAALAGAKGVPVREVTVCILDRPRHAKLIEQVKAAGASLRLIADGDIAGVIHVTEPLETGIDMYMGIGGAPEGVLAAAALACIGGQMQGRLVAVNDQQRARARRKLFRLEPQIRDPRHDPRRPLFRRHRHHRRLAAQGRALHQGGHCDPYRGDARLDPHGPVDEYRAPRHRQVRLTGGSAESPYTRAPMVSAWTA